MKQATPPQDPPGRSPHPDSGPHCDPALPAAARILIVGGGYVGMYAALRLQRGLSRGEAKVTLVEPQPSMTYQPFLAEAAAGSMDPRHVVVPLRQVLHGCTVVSGKVTRIDTTACRATTATTGAPDLELGYDLLVIAAGSASRRPPVPGLAEHGIGFATVQEAVGLRNHVLEQLDIASSTRDLAVRQAALTFVVVGGGFAGIEALAELEDMARHATRHYRNISAGDLRWILVEAGDRILREATPTLGRQALAALRRRNIEIRLNTRLQSAEGRVATLSDGTRLAARTLIWTAGAAPAPALLTTDLPRDTRGKLCCASTLQVTGTTTVWAAGDCAAVPDLTRPGEYCAHNAQHAVRQARVLGDNVLAHLRGKPQSSYRHALSGSAASLGLHKGVAELHGLRLAGRPAWLLHRAYHLSRMPTFNRKARLLADWLVAGLSPRDTVSLGSLEHPRAEFEETMRRSDGPGRRPPEQPE